MKEVLSWIVEHYELLILVGACLLDVVLFLFGVFKKRVDPSLTNVISQLPGMISHAEKLFGNGHGEEKKESVLECAVALYYELTGIRVTKESRIYRFLGYALEEILDTPQRKGK